ncbi:MAG: DEAD/DEAH box helicase [Alphaproteobacteria bacterium]|nr:DEAD/DEAH box helicase [Alphaproteobacteria bacterium]
MTQDFNGFGLPAKLLQALSRLNFTTPTPIQEQAIPVALEGRDILGSAQTGTGKTGAFGIPVVARLLANPKEGALVLTPTRELASQVMTALQKMIPDKEIKTALLIGGDSIFFQQKQLSARPRLIVATPGRLNDHLARGSAQIGHMHTLVLDETDRMLDMGFGPQLEKIVDYLPEERQTLMFSATMPAQIERLSGAYLKNPVRISVGSLNAPAKQIQQELLQTTDADKYQNLVSQLDQRDGSIIIFVKTKFGTERLAERLSKENQSAAAIHGDLQQRKRERVIRSFRKKEYRILVATDVAARGLDIPHVAHVINYDLPQCPEDYIHRIGRTARAGADGQALNLITPADRGKWKAIHRLMNGEDVESPAFEAPRKGGARKFSRPGSFKKGFGKRREDDGGFNKERSSDRRDRGDRAFGDRRTDGQRSERRERDDRAFGERRADGQRFERREESNSFAPRREKLSFQKKESSQDTDARPSRRDDRGDATSFDSKAKRAPFKESFNKEGPRGKFSEPRTGERREHGDSASFSKGKKRPFKDGPARPFAASKKDDGAPFKKRNSGEAPKGKPFTKAKKSRPGPKSPAWDQPLSRV